MPQLVRRLLGPWPLLVALQVPSQILAAAEVPLSGGFPVTTRDRIMRVEDVRRGQRGIGYTVFQADRPEPFQVEILGVMQGLLGPGQDVVLARLSGDAIEYTGVIAGMSGSPVYVNGHLLGAVAYRFGMFSKEPIAGITPAASMIAAAEATGGRRARTSVFSLAPPGTPIGVDDIHGLRTRSLRPASPNHKPTDLREIATPLASSGLGPGARETLARSTEPLGFRVVGGAASLSNLFTPAGFTPRRSDRRNVEKNRPGEAGTVAAAPIAPGSPIGALLMRGDINVTAIGTVTMVFDGQVWGFGHPFVGYGQVAFPMATAAILNTLASDMGSYKQGVPAREVGAITQDRLTAIAGRLGQAAPMIPAQVSVRDHPDHPHAVRFTQVEIVDDPVWFPMMLESAIASAASRHLDYEAGGTVELEFRLYLPDRVVSFSEAYAAPAPQQVSALAARDAAGTAGAVLANGFSEVKIQGAEALIRSQSDVLLARVVDATTARPNVSPGERVAVRVRLRPFRGPERIEELVLMIPATAKGQIKLMVGGGLALDQRDEKARGRRTPRVLDDLLALLTERRSARGLYGRLYTEASGIRRDMEGFTALPPSVRATLLAETSPGSAAVKEALGPETKVQTPEVIAGGLELTLKVEQ